MLMKADRVDPHTFEAMLRSLADAEGVRRDAQAGFLEDRGPEDRGLGRSRQLTRVAKVFGDARRMGEACISW